MRMVDKRNLVKATISLGRTDRIKMVETSVDFHYLYCLSYTYVDSPNNICRNSDGSKLFHVVLKYQYSHIHRLTFIENISAIQDL